MSPVIYTITNTINSKLYVGYATNYEDRKRFHRNALRGDYHPNIHLQAAWNLYGEDNFLFEPLEECEEQFLSSQENYWCNILYVHNREYGYNIQPTGPNGHTRQSQESIEKRTRTRRERGNYTWSAERSREVPQEKRDRISKKLKGRKVPVEVILRVSISNSKPVLQYDLQGNFIKEFSSIGIAEKETKISHKTINKSINNTPIKFNKFIWKRKNNSL